MGKYIETAMLRFPRAAKHGRQYAVIVAVLIVGVVISLGLFVETRSREHKMARMDFLQGSQERISHLQTTIRKDLLLTEAVQALFLSSEEVTRGEFKAFVSPFIKNHTSLRALQWVPCVRASELSEYKKRASQEGYENFRIVQRNQDGRLTVVTNRDEYYPIYYVEPSGANVSPLGFDLATNPECLTAMNMARDTGQPASTSKILLYDEDNQTGVRLFFPVYRKSLPVNSVNDRRQALEGFVVGVLRIRDLVDGSLTSLQPGGIDILVTDQTNHRREQQLFFHLSRTRGMGDRDESPRVVWGNHLKLSETFEVAGRRWTVICTPAPFFLAAMNTWHPWFNASAALLLTILLASYLFRSTVHNVRMTELASQMSLVNARLEHEVADRKRLETELRKAKEAAEVSTVAKSRFLATMSHEIRTPMTSILGYTDLLADPTLGPSSRQNYLAVIRRSGEHLLMIINDILDLSRIEAGRLTLDIQPCNVVSLLADVASVVRPRAEQRGVLLTVDYPGPMPETIVTDGARLRQAIINLVGNAVKFTEQGSIRIVGSFLTSWRGGDPVIKIEVIDTGIGIREEMLPTLFQPFSQGDVSVYQKFGGTGLGLAISHEIARLLGGELTATSRLGEGSTFTLILPTGNLKDVPMLDRPMEVAHDAAGHHWELPMVDLQGVHILLAEDGYDNRELIQTVLRQAGAEVESVENGRQAVDRAKANSYDIILMDMNMPEMDGLAATRILRHDGYVQPILALTANAMAADVERCRKAGCNEHLAKPINRLQLIQKIASFAGRQVPDYSADAPTPISNPTEQDTGVVSELAGDPEMAEILGGFVGHLEERVAELREARKNGKYDELKQFAHRLKGAGGSYGYSSLSQAAAILEEAAKASDPTGTADSLEAVAALCQSIQAVYAAQTGKTVKA